MEMMIVIAIIGIISAIAVPNMISWRATNKLRGAVFNCQADMQKAKFAAIKYGAIGVVDFAPPPAAGLPANSYLAYVDLDMDGTYNAGDRILAARTLPAGLTLTSASFFGSGSRISFNSRGLPVGTPNGTVVITNSAGNSSTLTVNRIGRIRL